MNNRILLTFGLIILLAGGFFGWRVISAEQEAPKSFDGQRAYKHVINQVAMGPRTPGSVAHKKAIDYFGVELEKNNWMVDIQTAEVNGKPIYNVIARRSDVPPQIILAAHYDSRLLSERDPDIAKQQLPVPGANDGASGTAILLELARVLPTNTVPIWLVFFDAEDQGGIPGWEDWSLGAQAFVNAYNIKPRAVVVLDMVGDSELNITMEKQSNKALTNEIWEVARQLGYGSHFIPRAKYNITDDHTPFLEAGIPAVDIIDIEYRYWHTTEDLPKHVSVDSLQIVGSTILKWVTQQNR